jgi:ABC-type antimicrobial peptide transport system permease subunit
VQGVKQLIAGLVVGVPMGIALVKMLEQTSLAQGSMMLYVIIPTLISAVIFMAIFYPVQRALKLEPCSALRYE